MTPNQESVGSITVLSTSFSAEDGRNSGAQIKTVTKSGTDTVHGSLYFREDQPGLNAYAKVGGLGGGNALPLRVNNRVLDYAGSLGGPIKKDKIFLFTSFEGNKFVSNTYVNQFVETPAYDNAVLALRASTVTGQILSSGGVNPRVAQVLTPTCSYYIAQGYPCAIVGNGMDIGSFASVANGSYLYQANCDGTATNKACMAGYARNAGGFSTGAGLDGIADLQYAQLLIPSHSHGNQFNGRFDYYITPKDQFAASVYVTKLDNYGTSGATGSRPQGDLPFKPLNEAITGIYIHTFSPKILNEFRANATRFADNAITDAGGTVNYGLPYIDIQTIPGGNDVNYGTSAGPTSPAILAENTYEVRDAVTFVQGPRTLKSWRGISLGAGQQQPRRQCPPHVLLPGLFNFANNAPIYEGITADPTTGGPANTARYLRSETLGLFVQHDWKVAPTFTLNTGVRYEYFSPFHNKGMEVNLLFSVRPEAN